MRRLVTGKIFHTDDTPWVNARVYFKRVSDSFTASTQYPADTIYATTDDFGTLKSLESARGVYLWVNESGENVSKYECFLPGDASFEFSLPATDSSEIELGVLRIGGTPLEQFSPTIISYVEQKVAELQVGSTQVFSNEIIATTDLSALRVINLATGTYASNDNLIHGFAPLGLTTNSVVVGSSFKVLIFGEIFDAGWAWESTLIYLGQNGNLTQSVVGNEEFIKVCAKPIKPNSLLFEFKESIINKLN